MDFPEADRPVSQIVKPCCFLRVLRSLRERAASCQVMFLAFVLASEVVMAGLVG